MNAPPIKKSVYQLSNSKNVLKMIPFVLLMMLGWLMGFGLFRQALASGDWQFKAIFMTLGPPLLIALVVSVWWMRRGSVLEIEERTIRHINGKGKILCEESADSVTMLQPFTAFLQRRPNAFVVHFSPQKRVYFDHTVEGYETLILQLEHMTGKSFGLKA